MTGKISDLTSADRLRSADVFELQDQTIVGSPQMDALTLGAGIPFDTTTQLLGYSGDTMEVDATTLAARLTLRPQEINYPPAGFAIGHYAWSASNFQYLTGGSAAITADAILTEFGWINTSGIAIVKKIYANMAVGASTNTASGIAQMRLIRTFGIGPLLDTSDVNFPPPQGGNGVTGRAPATVGSMGMRTNQPPAQARINAGINRVSSGSNRTGGNASQAAFLDPVDIGEVNVGFAAGAGNTIFRESVLFDWLVAGQPLILVPGTGFEVHWSLPTTSSGSSTTLMPFVNLQWDEWTLSAPDDR